MALRVHCDVECPAGPIGRARMAFDLGPSEKFGRRYLDRYDLVGESAEVAGHGQYALYEPGCQEVASNTQYDINFREAARQPFRPSHAGSVRRAGARTGPAGLSCYECERRCCG